jgi:hypothetical protein
LTGVFALTGIYLRERAETGTLGLVGYAANAAGIIGAFGIEYTLRFVFRSLSAGQIDGLLHAGTGRAFLVTSLVLALGALVFGAATLRAGLLPRTAAVLYVTGMIALSLRTTLPVPVYGVGVMVAGVGIGWLGYGLRAIVGEEEAERVDALRAARVRA